MGKSLAMQIAELSDAERAEVMAGLDAEGLLWDWSFWSRPEQRFPDDDSWDVGLFLAGRGAGKTRSCAEWVRDKAKISGQGTIRFLLVARTTGDVRQTVVDGESGVLNISPPSEMPDFKPSVRELHWPNGNIAVLRTADEPDGIRGTQSHFSWGDEIAAWRQTPDSAGLTAWGNLQFATRLGRNPQIVASTTPKRVQLLYDLINNHENPQPNTTRVFLTRGSTYDNAGNLPASNLNALTGTYGGTRIGQQELMGEMLDAVEGALWSDQHITDAQGDYPSGMPLRIIGVDPSVAENPGDECGIVAVGATAESDLFRRKAWVLEDASVQGAPEVWAKEVVRMARKYGCPVVAEVNQGASLIAGAIHQIDPDIQVLEVHARQGKQLRAEPVTLAYDQKRVTHVRPEAGGNLTKLEEQMTSWIPGEGKSPDRVDALVHALTAMLIKPPKGYVGGNISAKSPGDRRIGITRRGRRGGLPYMHGGGGRGGRVR
ncbi:MAG: ATP-binding protein [Cytophagaceae bacterium]|nr:MAG: ATP-binding protein [Cytophagaceae bacterium]